VVRKVDLVVGAGTATDPSGKVIREFPGKSRRLVADLVKRIHEGVRTRKAVNQQLSFSDKGITFQFTRYIRDRKVMIDLTIGGSPVSLTLLEVHGKIDLAVNREAIKNWALRPGQDDVLLELLDQLGEKK